MRNLLRNQTSRNNLKLFSGKTVLLPLLMLVLPACGGGGSGGGNTPNPDPDKDGDDKDGGGDNKLAFKGDFTEESIKKANDFLTEKLGGGSLEVEDPVTRFGSYTLEENQMSFDQLIGATSFTLKTEKVANISLKAFQVPETVLVEVKDGVKSLEVGLSLTDTSVISFMGTLSVKINEKSSFTLSHTSMAELILDASGLNGAFSGTISAKSITLGYLTIINPSDNDGNIGLAIAKSLLVDKEVDLKVTDIDIYTKNEKGENVINSFKDLYIKLESLVAYNAFLKENNLKEVEESTEESSGFESIASSFDDTDIESYLMGISSDTIDIFF